MSDWIKCSERMPPSGVAVLVYKGKSNGEVKPILMTFGTDGSKKWMWADKYYPEHITHWMLLPQPPNSLA